MNFESLQSARVSKEGYLAKKGLGGGFGGFFHKPWAIRNFKLYSKHGVITYATTDGVLRGCVKIEDAVVQKVPESEADGKAYAFRVVVRKLSKEFAPEGAPLTLDCAASSKQERDEWMKAMATSVSRCYRAVPPAAFNNAPSTPTINSSTQNQNVKSPISRSQQDQLQPATEMSTSASTNTAVAQDIDIVSTETKPRRSFVQRVDNEDAIPGPRRSFLITADNQPISNSNEISIKEESPNSRPSSARKSVSANTAVDIQVTKDVLEALMDEEDEAEVEPLVRGLVTLKEALIVHPFVAPMLEIAAVLYDILDRALCYRQCMKAYCFRVDAIIQGLFQQPDGIVIRGLSHLHSNQVAAIIEEELYSLCIVLTDIAITVYQLARSGFLVSFFTWRDYIERWQRFDAELFRCFQVIRDGCVSLGIECKAATGVPSSFDFPVRDVIMQLIKAGGLPELISTSSKQLQFIAKHMDCEESILKIEFAAVGQPSSGIHDVNLKGQQGQDDGVIPLSARATLAALSSTSHGAVINHIAFRELWTSHFDDVAQVRIQVFLHKVLEYLKSKASFTEGQCLDLIGRFAGYLSSIDFEGNGQVNLSGIVQMTRHFSTSTPLAETISTILKNSTADDPEESTFYHHVLPYMDTPAHIDGGNEDDGDDSDDDTSASFNQGSSSIDQGFSYSIYTAKSFRRMPSFQVATVTSVVPNQSLARVAKPLSTATYFGARRDIIELSTTLATTNGWLCVHGQRGSGKTTRMLLACKDLSSSRHVVWFDFEGYVTSNDKSPLHPLLGSSLPDASEVSPPNPLFSIAAAQLGMTCGPKDNILGKLNSYLQSLCSHGCVLVIDGVLNGNPYFQEFFNFFGNYAKSACIAVVFAKDNCDGDRDVDFVLERSDASIAVAHYYVSKLDRLKSVEMIQHTLSANNDGRQYAFDLSTDDLNAIAALADDIPGTIIALSGVPITFIRQFIKYQHNDQRNDSLSRDMVDLRVQQLFAGSLNSDEKAVLTAMRHICIAQFRFEQEMCWKLCKSIFSQDLLRWQRAFKGLQNLGWVVSTSDHCFKFSSVAFDYVSSGSVDGLEIERRLVLEKVASVRFDPYFEYWTNVSVTLNNTLISQGENLPALTSYCYFNRNHICHLFSYLIDMAVFFASFSDDELAAIFDTNSNQPRADALHGNARFDKEQVGTFMASALLLSGHVARVLELLQPVSTLDQSVGTQDYSAEFSLAVLRSLVRLGLVNDKRGYEDQVEHVHAKFAYILCLVDLASFLLRLGRFDDGLAIAETCMAELQEHQAVVELCEDELQSSSHNLSVAGSKCGEALILYAKLLILRAGNHKGGEHDDELIIHLLISAGATSLAHGHIMQFIEAYQALATFYIGILEYSEAASVLEEAIGQLKATSGNDASAAQEIAAMTCSHAELAVRMGDTAKAKELFTMTLDMWKSQNNPDIMKRADGLVSLGQLHCDEHDFDEAAVCYEEALKLMSGKLGSDHVRTAALMHMMGDVLLLSVEYERAKELLDKALSVYLLTYGPENAQVSDVLFSLSRLNNAQGKTEVARQLLEKVYVTRLKVLGMNDASTLKAKHELDSITQAPRRKSAGTTTASGSNPRRSLFSVLGVGGKIE